MVGMGKEVSLNGQTMFSEMQVRHVGKINVYKHYLQFSLPSRNYVVYITWYLPLTPSHASIARRGSLSLYIPFSPFAIPLTPTCCFGRP